MATAPNIAGWYAGLTKPAFNPPNWIFGPVWSLLYAVMSVAAWLAWRSAPGKQANRILVIYALQLGVNLLWSVLFFGLHLPVLALIDCLVLLVLIILMAWFYGRFSALAGWLLLPYGLWVSFASLLNAAIVYLN
jgi:tryptophan-rich sensory protein